MVDWRLPPLLRPVSARRRRVVLRRRLQPVPVQQRHGAVLPGVVRHRELPLANEPVFRTRVQTQPGGNPHKPKSLQIIENRVILVYTSKIQNKKSFNIPKPCVYAPTSNKNTLISHVTKTCIQLALVLNYSFFGSSVKF